ncbi:MAG: ABC transporter ATP-binding protein [Filifactor alocis]|nr:ABC transporter ATP-binding protein [Filifactor alocis]
MGKLRIQDVHVRSGNRIYLNRINLSLEEGKTLTIVGESGSGKTMLSRLLIGQMPEDAEVSGSIFLQEQDLLSMREGQWKTYRGSVIAYIAQNPMALFNPNQTVGSHAVELFRSRLSVSKEESVKRLIEALELFHFKDPRGIVGKYPFQLSGGMLQRVMFAMMLELSPQILIADEPTSALDRHNTQTVINTLKRCKQKSCSMIVITHDYELVRQVADEVIIMKDGQIIEAGEAEKILEHPYTEYAKELMTPRAYLRYKEGE